MKVGGHMASATSLSTILTALYCSVLGPDDRVAVKVPFAMTIDFVCLMTCLFSLTLAQLFMRSNTC